MIEFFKEYFDDVDNIFLEFSTSLFGHNILYVPHHNIVV